MNKVLLLPALLLTGLPLHGQTPITIQNPSFEVGGGAALNPSGWNYGPVPNWKFTGPGPSGLVFDSQAPDGTTAVWSNGGSFSQDLGNAPLPNTTYTMQLFVANRYPMPPTPRYTLTLLAGTTQLCTTSAANPTVPDFIFQAATLVCKTPSSVPAGNLIISFGSDSSQLWFDKVTLTSTPPVVPPPSSHQATLTWTDTANPGGITYNVYRATGQCPGAVFTLLAGHVSTLGYTDTTVAAQQDYCYQVRAFDGATESVSGVILFVPGSVDTITVQ
jgi:hypothetical protein